MEATQDIKKSLEARNQALTQEVFRKRVFFSPVTFSIASYQDNHLQLTRLRTDHAALESQKNRISSELDALRSQNGERAKKLEAELKTAVLLATPLLLPPSVSLSSLILV